MHAAVEPALERAVPRQSRVESGNELVEIACDLLYQSCHVSLRGMGKAAEARLTAK
jgi:hypothetical protein